MKSMIYYTTNRLDERIMTTVQQQLLRVGLPIICVSLEPIEGFGKNIVMTNKRPSIMNMYSQIVAGLRHAETDFVFLCEHDVLYHPSHFELVPSESDVYYYNTNVWRWRWPEDHFITYDHLVSLSGLCVNREFLLRHYRHRLDLIQVKGWTDGRNPRWARRMGHEPGKSKKRGGIADEPSVEWRSEHPNLDIRHKDCLTPTKMTLESFRTKPTGWREGTFSDLTGWERDELWNW